MKLQYVPLLKALDAEKIALENIHSSTWHHIIPLFDIPRIPQSKGLPKYLNQFGTPAKTMIDVAIARISAVSAGRMTMVDAYHWRSDATIETGEHIFSYLINSLITSGILPVPVIGYDRWDDKNYQAAVGLFNYSKFSLTCLRLDYSAIEDSLEPDLLRENIEEIINHIEVHPSNCAILIDFGDVFSKTVAEMHEEAVRVIEALEDFNFKFYITAASSLPSTVDKAVRSPDTEGQLRRKEIALWKSISKTEIGQRNTIVYGDYAIRGPHSNEGIPNPNSNGKIRYTIDEHFFIARGHSVSTLDKFGQFSNLASRIISSGNYMSASYSWGDKQIENAVLGLTKKTHAFWISADTNHHIKYVIQEIQQYAMNNSLTSYTVGL